MRTKEQFAEQVAAVRQNIIETAFRVFAQRGIEAVSLPEIGRQSGLSRASVYRYFSSKQELAVAVSAWSWGNYLQQLRARTPEDSLRELTAAEHLDWYLDLFLDLYRNHRDLLRFNQFFNVFYYDVAFNEEQIKPYMDLIQTIRDSFHAIYSKAEADGSLKTEYSEETMVSAVIHLMLAAVTRYAVGLVYVPGTDDALENELLILKRSLLREFVREKE